MLVGRGGRRVVGPFLVILNHCRRIMDDDDVEIIIIWEEIFVGWRWRCDAKRMRANANYGILSEVWVHFCVPYHMDYTFGHVIPEGPYGGDRTNSYVCEKPSQISSAVKPAGKKVPLSVGLHHGIFLFGRVVKM